MGATVTEIARQAGVSVSLVSRLLRGDKTLRVSDTKRKQVLAVTDRLGGVRYGRGRRSLAHHVVVPVGRQFSADWIEGNLSNAPFMRGFEDGLREKNFRLSFTFFDPEDRLRVFADLTESPGFCDGVLLLSGGVDAPLAGVLLKNRFPHVSMDTRAVPFGVNTVLSDAAGGMREAVDHLAALGHRRIGYVGPSRPRYPVFLAAKAEAGLSVNEAFNCPHAWPNGGGSGTWASTAWTELSREAFGQWLDRGPTATAMICHNDMVAFGVLDALRERGLTAGRDVSVVGYDNIEQRGPDAAAEPALTTIDNPLDEVGRRSAELLFEQILNRNSHVVHRLVPTQCLVRRTTGPGPDKTE